MTEAQHVGFPSGGLGVAADRRDEPGNFLPKVEGEQIAVGGTESVLDIEDLAVAVVKAEAHVDYAFLEPAFRDLGSASLNAAAAFQEDARGHFVVLDALDREEHLGLGLHDGYGRRGVGQDVLVAVAEVKCQSVLASRNIIFRRVVFEIFVPVDVIGILAVDRPGVSEAMSGNC